jgi:hypothetical protein
MKPWYQQRRVLLGTGEVREPREGSVASGGSEERRQYPARSLGTERRESTQRDQSRGERGEERILLALVTLDHDGKIWAYFCEGLFDFDVVAITSRLAQIFFVTTVLHELLIVY